MNQRQKLEAMFKSYNTTFNKGIMTQAIHWAQIAMEVPSSGDEETYSWIGELPMMREWLGERVIKELAEHGYSIKNKLFEATIAVPKTRVDDDSYGIYAPAVQQMGANAALWPDTLVFNLLAKGFETPCYDGKSFFNTDHKVGKTAFSNRSNKPLTLASYEEARSSMMSLTNDEGTPLNIVPNLLVVPPALEGIARSILKSELVAGANTTVSNVWKDTADVLVVPGLAGHPKKWFLMQTTGAIKPLIWQVRENAEFQGMTNPDSENVFMLNKYVYGTRARGNAGFAFWQLAWGSTGE